MTPAPDGAAILAEVRAILAKLRPRVLVCHPDRKDALQAKVEELGAGLSYTVQASPACEPDQVLVINPNALGPR